MTEKALIPFKSVNLSSIQRLIDKAMARTRIHYGTEPTGEDFEAFVQDLFSAFKNLRYDVFFASVMSLAGQCLTREVIRDVAWRLAGNLDKLKSGRPIPPWTAQTDLEWCPITILRGNPGISFKGKFGFFYEYRVMAGQAAGLKFTTFWTLKYARFIARSIGFCRTRVMDYKLTDGTELVCMRLYILLDPACSLNGNPGSYHFYVPATCKKYNQDILLQRFRVRPCPLGYSLTEMPCHNCPKGYDECLAGCHPKTFTAKLCPRCKKDSWFDPLGRGVICIDCDDQDRRHHVKN